MVEKEFHVNEHLSLKLINNKTQIYIHGKLFLQCKSLLLTIPKHKTELFGELESIDEFSEQLGWTLENNDYQITPEIEFWGHCSNLQTWYEHNYDTRLIHSNLAFPLLKELANKGDKLAIQVFGKEIMERLRKGTINTITFLLEEKYTDFINRDSLLYCILDEHEAEKVMRLEKKINSNLSISYNLDDEIQNAIVINNKYVIGINFNLLFIDHRLFEILELISKFENLIQLNISECDITEIPPIKREMKNILYLYMMNNKIKKICDEIGNFAELEELDLRYNKLTRIPEKMGKLHNLRILDLRNNQIQNIPESIGNLENLRRLDLRNNQIQNIPESIEKLNKLKLLHLENNPLPPKTKEILNAILKKKRVKIIF